MKLSSAYLYEKLKCEYEIAGCGGISGQDGYLRPFFYLGISILDVAEQKRESHVCVVGVESESQMERLEVQRAQDEVQTFRVYCLRGDSSLRGTGAAETDLSLESAEAAWRNITEINGEEDLEAAFEGRCAAGGSPYLYIALQGNQNAADVMNEVQQLFDCCEEWECRLSKLAAENAGTENILQAASEFLGNPLMVMGVDFTLVAEVNADMLPARARLFTEDGINIEYMNALVQDASFQKLAKTQETTLFPAYISGCRSLNRNLYVEGRPTHRLVMPECETLIMPGHICILEALARQLESLLAHESSAVIPGDLEQIFQRVLSDRTADYVQVSRQLSALGWSVAHEYLCLILQITYLNQQQLSTKAICRYIRKQLPDSISFLYKDEIVTFFNLTRLGLHEDEVSSRLVYFIRDSYLKAGYSRAMKGHMNLRRQYVQAQTALDVGSRKKPYLWIHHFNQVVLTYIMEQATRHFPGSMICHEGLLKLRETDEKNHTEYMQTLKTFLEQHLNATQTAKELYIHRSTFLYRLERIKEILQSDLEDPEELFYLELSVRLLEQEEEKN